MYPFFYGQQSLNTQLFLVINQLHHPLLDPLMQAMIYLGSSKMVYFYAGALALFIRIQPRKMSWRYPALYLLATLVGVVLQGVLKEVFQVPRPALALGIDQVRVLGELKLHNAFPSGHAVFGGVTAMTVGWRRSWVWKLPLWLFALLVAWSRVYVGVHYPVDVAGGLALGALIGWLIWLGSEKLAKDKNRKG